MPPPITFCHLADLCRRCIHICQYQQNPRWILYKKGGTLQSSIKYPSYSSENSWISLALFTIQSQIIIQLKKLPLENWLKSSPFCLLPFAWAKASFHKVWFLTDAPLFVIPIEGNKKDSSFLYQCYSDLFGYRRTIPLLLCRSNWKWKSQKINRK